MTLGRSLEYDREYVLEAAMNLFWRTGYEATSVQDLLDRMQLSKLSLYQVVGSKRSLFLKCIRRYHANALSEMAERLDRVETGLAFVRETLSGVIAGVNEPASPRG